MSKIWMMSGVAVAALAAVMVWGPQPARSSDDLLAKAQSEFAAKARDAVIERRVAQASTAAASITTAVTPAAPQSDPSPYVVASLEPVAPPTVVAREVPAAEPPIAEADAVDTPVVASRNAALPAAPLAAPAVDTPAAAVQMASLPEEPTVSVSSKPDVAVVELSDPVTTDTPAFTPTRAKPRQYVKTVRKTRPMRKAPATNTYAHRYQPRASGDSLPYNLESLRARAPQIAAAIARYM